MPRGQCRFMFLISSGRSPRLTSRMPFAMSEPKRIYAGRPRDRSFEAYVDWIRDFVARLVPNAAVGEPPKKSHSEC